MSDALKVLVIGDEPRNGATPPLTGGAVDLVRPESLGEGLRTLRQDRVDAVVCYGPRPVLSSVLLEQSGLLEQLPDGYCLLDLELRTLWINAAFARLIRAAEQGEELATAAMDVSREGLAPAELIGRRLPELLGEFEFLGPDYNPLQTALAMGETASGGVRLGEKSFCDIHATPIFEGETGLDLDDTQFRAPRLDGGLPGAPNYLLVSVRDTTAEVVQRNKLNAIYSAGQDLGDLQPEEVLEMSVEERTDLLRSKILHYTEDLLQYETFEVRLFDHETNELKPLLAHGMREDAENRRLFAEPEGFGVTGFVAATGRSYLCDDTERDKLYLSGAPGARSSLTVPLTLHDEILGTFNVESPQPGAFSNADLQFLEMFGREVAMALNTLELLAVEKSHTASEAVRRILCGIAGPIDEILNDSAWVFERNVGNDPEVAGRLKTILEKTREVRRLVRQAGEVDGATPLAEGAALRGRRMLVADADPAVRQAAHDLLGRFGAFVETAHDGGETLLMARTAPYDVVISDIKPPDMPGSKLFRDLRDAHEHLPIILMTGYGYDPSHTLVKAREMGLTQILFKPFRLEQLLKEVGKAVAGAAGCDA